MLIPQGRSFTSLLFAGSLLALTACGSSVTVFGEGAGGDGGAGGSGLDGPGGGDPCSPVESCNPAPCPTQMPSEWDVCPSTGLQCAYDDGSCVLTFECQGGEDCWDGGSGGWGGGGSCEAWTAWQIEGASCDAPPVACGQAQEGDPCGVPGEYCSEGIDCEWLDKECGADHKWHVYEYYEECCYDECCYDGPSYCPESVPVQGDYCDPCYEGPVCDYAVETQCGIQSVTAVCTDYDWTWEVSPLDPCVDPA